MRAPQLQNLLEKVIIYLDTYEIRQRFETCCAGANADLRHAASLCRGSHGLQGVFSQGAGTTCIC